MDYESAEKKLDEILTCNASEVDISGGAVAQLSRRRIDNNLQSSSENSSEEEQEEPTRKKANVEKLTPVSSQHDHSSTSLATTVTAVDDQISTSSRNSNSSSFSQGKFFKFRYQVSKWYILLIPAISQALKIKF